MKKFFRTIHRFTTYIEIIRGVLALLKKRDAEMSAMKEYIRLTHRYWDVLEENHWQRNHNVKSMRKRLDDAYEALQSLN